jgi:hypothetical protein
MKTWILCENIIKDAIFLNKNNEFKKCGVPNGAGV